MSLAFIDDNIEVFSRAGFDIKNSALGYFGGKFNAVPGLLRYFPQPHSNMTYFEVFCGSAVVALNYNPILTILNDKDDELINFLRVLGASRFQALLERNPHAPPEKRAEWAAEAWMYDEFHTVVDGLVRSPKTYRRFAAKGDAVSRAIAYYLGNRNNFSNIPKDNFDYIQPRRKPLGEVHYQHLRDFLRDCEVRVWDLDFRECLAKAAGWEDTKLNEIFIYLDPPYLAEQGYQLRFSEDDLRELAEMLKDMPHRWIMSNEDSDIVREHFQGWSHLRKVKWSYTCSVKCSTKDRHELLVSNRPFVKRGLRYNVQLKPETKQAQLPIGGKQN